jgi:hypothetical protein
MSEPSVRRGAWWRISLLVGVFYFAIGRLFALPTFNVPSFRWAAWVIAFVAYVAHIWFEHVRLRNAPRVIALHVSAAVGIGALLLAVAAMVHNIGLKGAAVGPAWLISLVAWPLVAGIPAFLATLVGALVLARRDRPVQRP